MNKQKLIPVLSAVLVLQLLLAGGLYWSNSSSGSDAESKKLLDFNADQVDGVRIEDGKSAVELSKVNQEWRLPGIDFPAANEKVKKFLDKLTTMKRGWPVATTSDAAKRFKVTDTEFERKITFRNGDKTLAVLYLGTAPSYRVLNARLDGSSDIYGIELSTYDAGVKDDDWIDKEVLQHKAEDIASVTMDNGLTLERKDDKWTLDGLKDNEQPNVKEIETLINKLANLRVDGVLGKEKDLKDKYNFDKTLTMTLKDGKTITYNMVEPEKETYYVLKSSALDDYLRVPGYTMKVFVNLKRDDVVQPKEKDKPEQQKQADSGKK